jgi:hypothetical protein
LDKTLHRQQPGKLQQPHPQKLEQAIK